MTRCWNRPSCNAGKHFEQKSNTWQWLNTTRELLASDFYQEQVLRPNCVEWQHVLLQLHLCLFDMLHQICRHSFFFYTHSFGFFKISVSLCSWNRVHVYGLRYCYPFGNTSTSIQWSSWSPPCCQAPPRACIPIWRWEEETLEWTHI